MVGWRVGASSQHQRNQPGRSIACSRKNSTELYVWFNEFLERETQDFRHVTELADADMAHKVYHNYREEVVNDMAEFFQLSSTEQKAEAIPEEDRSAVLHSLLSDFDLKMQQM